MRFSARTEYRSYNCRHTPGAVKFHGMELSNWFLDRSQAANATLYDSERPQVTLECYHSFAKAGVTVLQMIS